MKSKKSLYLLITLLLILFLVNYKTLDNLLINFFDESEFGVVERVIDGDTIIVNNESVRLLGINSPEKGHPYYKEAKEYLETLILNKTIKLEPGKQKYDKYQRLLAYIYLQEENINLRLIGKGFANPYFPSGKDQYYESFNKAWETCINSDKNLCKKSEDVCSDCILLKNFDYKNEIITLYNQCNFECGLTNWEIKDEGRKTFVFPEFILDKNSEVGIIVEEGINNQTTLFWTGEDYVFTRSGDTLFLRDGKGELVLWRNY